jgi:hypothetical protein
MPIRFETSDDDPWLMAVLIEAPDDALTASSIQQLLVEAPAPR